MQNGRGFSRERDDVLDRILIKCAGPIRCIKYTGETFLRALGPVLILFAMTLISVLSIIWFTELMPFYTPYGTLLNLPHTALSIFVLFNIIFNYLMTVMTPPGSPPAAREEEKELLENLKREPAPRRGEGFSRYCKVCKKVKPPRAHHCHICNMCVLKMDHHCPWVANCVGHFNHKFFYLFMFYTWVATFYLSIFSVGILFDMENIIQTEQITSLGGFPARTIIMFTFALCISVSCALGLLLGWHTYLALSAQTTIEFYFNRFNQKKASQQGQVYYNEYDLGYSKNWNLFFGSGQSWFSWLLPSLKPTPGDGITYLTRNELVRNTSLIV